MGKSDSQRVVEKHYLRGTNLLSLHNKLVSTFDYMHTYESFEIYYIKFIFLCSDSVDQIVEKYGLQKITLLREISIKTGIQVKIKIKIQGLFKNTTLTKVIIIN